MSDAQPQPTPAKPRWQPISALDRRVLGVLVEKAKTTPDTYPMSVNALRSGANQKNNRYPLMEVELEDIEESLARLRALGAVAEVQGSSRVARFRHYMYEWMGIDKLELAVMAELLLRGAQTEGELRGRAARMDPIPDLNALRPVLALLKEKGLVISLSPEGRGHMVSHALYEPRELEKVRAEAQAAGHALQESGGGHSATDPSEPRHANPSAAPAPRPAVAGMAAPASAPERGAAGAASESAAVAELRRELEQLRTEMAQVRKDLDDLWSNFR